jgi:hypothetical protein
MLSALVRTSSAPGALALTLAGLVPAVAEGLLSHAVVLTRKPDADSERIADAMGASLVASPSQDWRLAAEAARGSWLLLLDAGDALDEGWIAAIERHLMLQAPPAFQPAFLPRREVMGRLRARFALANPAGRIAPGLLAPRTMVMEGRLPGSPVLLAGTRSRG